MKERDNPKIKSSNMYLLSKINMKSIREDIIKYKGSGMTSQLGGINHSY